MKLVNNMPIGWQGFLIGSVLVVVGMVILIIGAIIFKNALWYNK